jgi:small subunit ribosomal protein S6
MVSEKELEVVEDELAHSYELVMIISPEVTEEKLGPVVDGITQYITTNGGAAGDVEHWGKKKLAYPIRHFMEGYYVLVRFKMRAEFTKGLKGNLHISENFLRHLLVKLED